MEVLDRTPVLTLSDDDNKVWWLPAFIRWFFVKKYMGQGLVQMDNKTKELTICGDVIRWLDRFSVETTSSKRADRLMFEHLHEKYPQYKDYIQIF